jgi:tRNA (guanine10-N2)-dimethyltransferase
MYIAILGRQPQLGTAELERVFGGKAVKPISPQTVTIDCDSFEIQNFGGVPKAGKIIFELPRGDWNQISQKIIQFYSNKWSSFDGKITLGISVYDLNISAREVQKTGIILKQKLKKSDVSLRLVPNTESALNTAVSHHNKLGLSNNKVELLIVHANDGSAIIAESTGAQNITAYARRDQERPKRDAFVGMLPPKLAQIMLNLAGLPNRMVFDQTLSDSMKDNPNDPQDKYVLDPFCGTGVILQEAVLIGYYAYGTDLSEKMISYSHDNLEWLIQGYHTKFNYKLSAGDAMTIKWQQPIDAVVSETYLGQPFSAPPSPTKLIEVRDNCNYIISEFLKNLAPQIKPGTPICLAVPAWRDMHGYFTHLPLIATIARLGYKPHEFTNVSQNDMLYYRENQVVARELLVLTKI